MERLAEQSILAALALYEALNSAPTSFEVWQRLVNPAKFGLKGGFTEAPSLGQVRKLLDSGQVAGAAVGFRDGFYYLAGSEPLAAKRSASIRISQRKISLAKRRLKKVLPFCPFILGVALEGSVVEGRAKASSDIDLLVICRSGRIWTARLFFDRILSLLGWRRPRALEAGRGSSSAYQDKFCLNHYLTPADLKTQPGLYHAFLHSHLIPLWEAQPGIFDRFLQANPWIRNFLPNTQLGPLGPALMEIGSRSNLVRHFWERFLGSFLGEPLEALTRFTQKKIIARNPLTYKKGGRIRVDDKQLEFHPILIENELQEKIRVRLKGLGIDN